MRCLRILGVGAAALAASLWPGGAGAQTMPTGEQLAEAGTKLHVCSDGSYDILQLSLFHKSAAWLAGQPTELCTPCGGFGEIACGPDSGRTCDAGLTAFPAIRGLASRVASRVAEKSDIAADYAASVAGRLRFCISPRSFPVRARPSPEPAPETSRRTYLLIPGMGGSVPDTHVVPAADPVRRLVTELYQQVWIADFNAGGTVDADGRHHPLRIFDVGADGRLTVIHEGASPQDGVAIDFRAIATGIAEALRGLPVEGTLTVIGYSMGGFITKDLVYMHEAALRADEIHIGEVIFLAHPHFAERAVSGADMASIFCTGLARGEQFGDHGFGEAGGSIDGSMAGAGETSGGSGFKDCDAACEERIFAQSCEAGRWLDGWNRMMRRQQFLRQPVRTIDDRDFPGIVWVALAGDSEVLKPGEENFYPHNVRSDGRTPTDSALGIDAFDRFVIDRLHWDESGAHDCGHAWDCLLAAVFDRFPMGPPRAGVRYTAVAGDSLWDIAAQAMGAEPGAALDGETAARVDAYWRLLMDANGLEPGRSGTIAPDMVLEMPAVGRIVAPGDTLWEISRSPGGAWPGWIELHRRNLLSLGEDPDLIFPGRMIRE